MSDETETVNPLPEQGKKVDTLEDLKKARWYLNYAITKLESGGNLT